MWQRTVPSTPDVSWSDAYAACERLELAGFADWRLPSLLELTTLHTTPVVPRFPAGLFDGTPGSVWTSIHPKPGTNTSVAVTNADPFLYGLDVGAAAVGHLCVRTASIVAKGRPEARYDTSVDGVVTDRRTQLTWERKPAAEGVSYSAAVAHCEALSMAGFSDYRLPTFTELMSTYDLAAPFPAGGGVLFGPAEGYIALFWSSTQNAKGGHIQVDYDYVRWNWGVSGDGTAQLGGTEVLPTRVRCVRPSK